MVQVSAGAAKTRIANLFRENLPRPPLSEADIQAELASEPHARLVFQPYVRIHSQLAAYQLKASTTNKLPLEKQVTNFYENRMLLIRLCEEQLHLIHRHSDREEDFGGSKAWDLLFELFRFHRQSFAELKAPLDHTPSRMSYSEVLKGDGAVNGLKVGPK